MSQHNAKVIKVEDIKPHPNADSLEIVKIGGFTVCVRLGEFKLADLAIYIEPETIVPTDLPQFSFLKKDGKTQQRIRVKKLRGIFSQGLLLKAPENAKVGDDYWDKFGLIHYEPPEPRSFGGDNEKGPLGFHPKYDIESFNKYNNIIAPNEEVVVTEKIHGCNARYCYRDGRIYCGSRTNWKKQDEKSVWWKALKQNPWIEHFCKLFEEENLTLYGEVFGQVQNLRYGSSNNEFFFRCFDIWNGNRWLDFTQMRSLLREDIIVPILYTGPFDESLIRLEAEKDSCIKNAKHHREGVVIKPVKERWDDKLGRVILKLVGNRYLSKD